MNMKDEVKKLRIKLEQIEKKLDKEDRLFVPACIQITSENDEYGSAYIINELNQGICKCTKNEGFKVGNDYINQNTGDDYELIKAESIEDGKLYYVTDFEDIEVGCKVLSKYVVGLKEDRVCHWRCSSGMEVHVQKYKWKHIFEVVKIQ